MMAGSAICDPTWAGRRRGFTLVEVLFATFIVVFVAMALFTSFIMGLRIADTHRRSMAADEMAFDSAWLRFNQPYYAFENITSMTNQPFVEAVPPETALGPNAAAFTTITPPLLTGGDYWEIRSRVVWNGHFGGPKTNDYIVRRYRTDRMSR
jgi:prepilin-type N-terminal cleavage/methylation domain-containing protein